MLFAMDRWQREKIELPFLGRAGQCETISYDDKMGIECDQQRIALRRGTCGIEERPSAAGCQHKPLSPESNERLRAQELAEIGERGLVGLKLKTELVAQKHRDAQNENRLPTEFGRRAFPFWALVRRD